jgi:hypothetical protein
MNQLFALFDPGTDKSLTDISLILGGLLAAVYYGKEIFFRKGTPQPLSVEVVKSLHLQFADKEIFEKHIANNTARHAQLFNQIDELAKETRIEMDKRFTDLNDERRRTLEKLNEQYVFIRENISAINRELQITGKR